VIAWIVLVTVALIVAGWVSWRGLRRLSFGPSDPLAAVLTLAGLAPAIWALRPAAVAERRRSRADQSKSQIDRATEHLADETLRHWRQEAKARLITTPSPASVRWRWGDGSVAISADQSQPSAVPTDGVVTELRKRLYKRMASGKSRIVIIGEAGAGKTTAMLWLLIAILEHRRAGSAQPVPVWVTLGGWNPDSTPLHDWASARLAQDYPGLAAGVYGGPGAAAALIRSGRVALFLDGLDELPTGLRGQALHAIDQDSTGLGLVLTSRKSEWAAAVKENQLWNAAVIEVLPIDVDSHRLDQPLSRGHIRPDSPGGRRVGASPMDIAGLGRLG
jgi:hypothetical protein